MYYSLIIYYKNLILALNCQFVQKKKTNKNGFKLMYFDKFPSLFRLVTWFACTYDGHKKGVHFDEVKFARMRFDVSFPPQFSCPPAVFCC